MIAEGAEIKIMAGRCILCNSENLEILKEAKQEVYATGDRKSFDVEDRQIRKVICKKCGMVQFLQNADHINAINKVFDDYDVLCVKQWSLNEKRCKPHLQDEYERIGKAISLPQKGKMLDIGCGGGESLFWFRQIYPEWDLYGMDIGEQFRCKVTEGGRFFASLDEIRDSGQKFDFVTVNQVLCLADNMVQILETVHDVLADNGIFFVMDTDYEVHPWMLYTIEHCVLFTKDSLEALLSKFGFEVLDINFEHEKKEISFFCSKKEISQNRFPDFYQQNKEIYERKIEYLNSIIDTVWKYVGKNRNIGIFGTSVAGIWLSEIITKGMTKCDGKNLFYVEEDEEILQRKADVGRYPVYRLEEIVEKAVIFLPFPDYIAESIQRRCESEYSNCEFVVFGQ